jgi:hypothetical protein
MTPRVNYPRMGYDHHPKPRPTCGSTPQQRQPRSHP